MRSAPTLRRLRLRALFLEQEWLVLLPESIWPRSGRISPRPVSPSRRVNLRIPGSIFFTRSPRQRVLRADGLQLPRPRSLPFAEPSGREREKNRECSRIPTFHIYPNRNETTPFRLA